MRSHETQPLLHQDHGAHGAHDSHGHAPNDAHAPKLGAGGTRMKPRPPMPKNLYQALLNVAFLPWLSFSLAGFLFLTCYHRAPALVGFLIIVWVILSIIGSIASKRRGALDQCYTLALCALAASAGSFVGGYNYCVSVKSYWDVTEHRQYTNVWPDESTASHHDASVIVFAKGTKPDNRLSTYFNSGEKKYCVAPITMKFAEVVTPAVQYWAVGQDCCTKELFECGSLDFKSRSGVVQIEKKDIYHDYLAAKEPLEFYKKAAKMASSKYEIEIAEEPIFLDWVYDVDAKTTDIWNTAVSEWVWAVIKAIPIGALLAFGAPGLKNAHMALKDDMRKWNEGHGMGGSGHH
eukprot:TRINITY_DN8948_c0_g2_i2.p1 TRINITY_DN8948_c0_g2~~TRINITY_DN8948_c0_g2_i2.p1  ORF type:complete len:348 (+),score=63.54 TRINITY_DN8948_c0_g2_i2:140-1183(+)